MLIKFSLYIFPERYVCFRSLFALQPWLGGWICLLILLWLRYLKAYLWCSSVVSWLYGCDVWKNQFMDFACGHSVIIYMFKRNALYLGYFACLRNKRNKKIVTLNLLPFSLQNLELEPRYMCDFSGWSSPNESSDEICHFKNIFHLELFSVI